MDLLALRQLITIPVRESLTQYGFASHGARMNDRMVYLQGTMYLLLCCQSCKPGLFAREPGFENRDRVAVVEHLLTPRTPLPTP